MNSFFFLGSVAAVISFFTLFRKFRFQQDNKESNSSSLSLPSPPTSLPRNWKHNVFPSFHGPDVRRAFLSHILVVFRGKGIDPFIDNHIPRSKSISPELIEAIRGSKIAIFLLSKNYASSSWCLDELAEIIKCREVLGQIVMTIFYEVDPTDIKKQTGDFGKAFRKTCKGKTKEHIERWRKALEDVATIAGEHSRNWSNEADMIEKIATDVSNMLNSSTPSRDFDGFVGMRAHLERMAQLLRLDLDEVRMIGIWGPPGIGKTTIARVLFNQVSSRFQLGAFMVDIKACYTRPCFDEYNAQLQLQNQMLSLIINQKDIMISHLGVAQERLKDKKVFLVLDEVDQLGQLDALAKEIQWFGPGSRIIVTTEDLRVLNAHGINHIYKVDFPSNDEAFQIFCMHAFGQKYPDDGFGELAWEVTFLAGNLPLGLKVLGSALRGKSKHEWKMTLPTLKTCLDGKIKNIIKFSYEALRDEDKDLFLYIACLFNYYNSVREVAEVLANKFSDVRHGLHVLAEKSLISIDKNRIEMHTLLEKFGRETSRKQYLHHGVTKRQLLVDERDICEVLSDDTTDSRRFIGIKLDLFETMEKLNISEKALERMSDLQFVRIKGNYDYPKRLESLLYHSQKIRLLHWEGFQNICLPSTFNPEFLVHLIMPDSKLQNLWEGTKQLKNLKWMDLRDSRDLKELPDLSTATNLEELILEDCSSLLELPPIGTATNLKELDISGCSSLVELPSSIGYLTNLEKLNLSNCSSLQELPPSIGTATNLKELDISGCSSLVELPSSIGYLTNLQRLYFDCSSLVKLPDSIGKLTNHRSLDFSDCLSLVELPSSIGYLTNLEILKLNNCSSLLELPPSIGTATNLQKLDISGCSNLVELPSSIGRLTNLQKLDIWGCSSLVKLPDSIGDITNLKWFNLSHCSSLLELPSSIVYLTNLQKLNISRCSSLVKLPDSIGKLTNLQKLDISRCSSLVKLPDSIGKLTNLQELDFSECSSLVELPCSIGYLTNLEILKLNNFPSLLELLPFIGTATNMKELDISGCSSLVKLPSSIGYLTNLEILNLSNCSSLLELPPSIGTATNMKELDISGCSSLVKLPQLSDSLSLIVAENCQSLERLDCSFNNPKISLNFPKCFSLNQEARDLIMTHHDAILPGTEVPPCFNHRATAGGSLKIKLNELPLPTSLRFEACIMLVKVNEDTGDDQIPMYVHIDIMDKQNDLKVPCTPCYHRIDIFLTEHIYTFEVEAKEVTSTELVFEFKPVNSKWKIGECGLLQIKSRRFLHVNEHDESFRDSIDGGG